MRLTLGSVVAVVETANVTCWPQWGTPSVELSRTRLRLELVLWTWPLPPPFVECAAKSATGAAAGAAASSTPSAMSARSIRFTCLTPLGRHPGSSPTASLVGKHNGHDEELMTRQM